MGRGPTSVQRLLPPAPRCPPPWGRAKLNHTPAGTWEYLSMQVREAKRRISTGWPTAYCPPSAAAGLLLPPPTACLLHQTHLDSALNSFPLPGVSSSPAGCQFCSYTQLVSKNLPLERIICPSSSSGHQRKSIARDQVREIPPVAFCSRPPPTRWALGLATTMVSGGSRSVAVFKKLAKASVLTASS